MSRGEDHAVQPFGHGTYQRYDQHRKHKDVPCQACREAMTRHENPTQKQPINGREDAWITDRIAHVELVRKMREEELVDGRMEMV